MRPPGRIKFPGPVGSANRTVPHRTKCCLYVPKTHSSHGRAYILRCASHGDYSLSVSAEIIGPDKTGQVGQDRKQAWKVSDTDWEKKAGRRRRNGRKERKTRPRSSLEYAPFPIGKLLSRPRGNSRCIRRLCPPPESRRSLEDQYRHHSKQD